MTQNPSQNSKGLFLLGLFLAIGFVVSSYLMISGFVKVKLSSQKKIYAKGVAERQVVSDLAIFQGGFSSVTDPDLKTASSSQQEKLNYVLSFLEKQGVKREDVAVAPPKVNNNYEEKIDEKKNITRIWKGYYVSQSVSVTSKNVDLIRKVDAAAGDLIRDGFIFSASAPQYLYTNTKEIKMDLLAEATKNARARAEQIVKNSGSSVKIGPLLSTSQGIFNITPLYSTETSWEGMNDTSSLEKNIRVVVSVEYALE